MTYDDDAITPEEVEVIQPDIYGVDRLEGLPTAEDVKPKAGNDDFALSPIVSTLPEYEQSPYRFGGDQSNTVPYQMARAMGKVGRPPFQPDWKALDVMCALQCTLHEVSAYFSVHPETLENAVKRETGMTFAEYMDTKRGKGKVALRRKQFQKAMAGDTAMLIWLGKQWLGQRDRPEQEDTTTVNLVVIDQ